MRDIYELLNDLDMKEENFEEMEVSEIERVRVKKNLKKSIRNKSKSGRKKVIAVAALAIVGTTVVGGTVTTYADRIPIVRDIFQALGNGIYKEYKVNANELNVTKSSNGTNITINDAVFDGRTVSLTYTIESDKDLGEEIYFWGNFNFKGLNKSGMVSDSNFIKINDNTYIGQENITLFDLADAPQDGISLTLDIDEINAPGEEVALVKGKWDFSLNIDAVQGEMLAVDGVSSKEGITAKVKGLTINPMSMFITYSHEITEEVLYKWDEVYLEVDVRDNLGNVYEVRDHGSSGDRLTNNYSATTEKLKEGVTQLIITPKALLKDLGEPTTQPLDYKNGITGETTVQNTEKWDCVEFKELIFDEIIVDVK